MGELEGAKTLLKEETLRITKHGRYGLPNTETVRMGRKRLTDAKRACIDESLREARALLECLGLSRCFRVVLPEITT